MPVALTDVKNPNQTRIRVHYMRVGNHTTLFLTLLTFSTLSPKRQLNKSQSLTKPLTFRDCLQLSSTLILTFDRGLSLFSNSIIAQNNKQFTNTVLVDRKKEKYMYDLSIMQIMGICAGFKPVRSRYTRFIRAYHALWAWLQRVGKFFYILYLFFYSAILKLPISNKQNLERNVIAF